MQVLDLLPLAWKTSHATACMMGFLWMCLHYFHTIVCQNTWIRPNAPTRRLNTGAGACAVHREGVAGI
jgi:hypothetical protein